MESEFSTPALPVRFSSSVRVTIHDAFLPTAGVLQCDAYARVQLGTVRRTLAGAFGGGNANNMSLKQVTIDVKEMGRTKSKLFTSRPRYEETFEFCIQDNEFLTSLSGSAPSTINSNTSANSASNENAEGVETTEDFIVISFEDGNISDNGNNNVSGTRDYFLGEAYCPFSPHCASYCAGTQKTKVMLQPRHAFQASHPLFLSDTRRLQQLNLDDFGYVTVSWEVKVIPYGGLLTWGNKPKETEKDLFGSYIAMTPASTEVSFPLGLTLKAHWLVPKALNQKASRFTTSVEFGGADRFIFENNANNSGNSNNSHLLKNKPLFLTLKNMAYVRKNNGNIHFHCSLNNVTRPEDNEDVVVPIPWPILSPKDKNNSEDNARFNIEDMKLNPEALDRDIFWAAPVRSPSGKDYGILLLTVRLSRKTLEGHCPLCSTHPSFCPDVNLPQHQEQFSHYMYTFPFMTGENAAAQLPDCPLGAYQTLLWESEEHYATALERKYKKSILIESQPRKEHIRHLFDILMNRSYMDVNLLGVIGAFFNKRETSEVNLLNVKEFLIAAAFHVKEMSVQEAARFCFIILRYDVEDAIHFSEVLFLFENCLVGKTVEMPQRELHRYMNELFLTATGNDEQNNGVFADFNNNPTDVAQKNNKKIISYDVFHRYFIMNFALWGVLGVPLKLDRRLSSEQRPHLWLGNTLSNSGTKNALTTAYNTNVNTMNTMANSNSNSSKNTGVSFSGATNYAYDPSGSAIRSGNALDGSNTNANGQNGISDGSGSFEAVNYQGSNSSPFNLNVAKSNNQSDNNTWRSFNVKVHKNQKRYAVTAHVNDKISDVKLMLENTIFIKAARQKWYYYPTTTGSNSTVNVLNNNNSNETGSQMVAIPSKELVGNTSLGLASAVKKTQTSTAQTHVVPSATTAADANKIEVLIKEEEESILLHFIYPGKNKKWSEHFSVNEKVIKVRATVQHKTLIPLSRIVLKIKNENRKDSIALLQDRHNLSHYTLESGSTIEVIQE